MDSRSQMHGPCASVILVPYLGAINPSCEHSLRQLERRGYTVLRVGGYANIDIARNQMATDALARGYQLLFWIDSDIGFHPDDVDRLIASGVPIASGIYVKKGVRGLASFLLPETADVMLGEQGGMVEIRYASTGFLATRREVYEAIGQDLPVCNEQFGKPMVPYFMPMVIQDNGKPWYLGDDYAFCERARRCGFKIWADTRIRLYHFGNYAYTWEDAGKDRERYASYRYQIGGTDKRPEIR